MQANETVRIYGKVVREWRSTDEHGRDILEQQEIEYKEYRANGELKSVGTEDFSAKRLREITRRWIYTWDGMRMNKGGHRWFDDQGRISYRGSTKLVKQLLKNKYHAALVELRA